MPRVNPDKKIIKNYYPFGGYRRKYHLTQEAWNKLYSEIKASNSQLKDSDSGN